MSGETISATRKAPWGPWVTLAFTLLIAVVFVVVETLLAIPYLIIKVAGSPSTPIETAANGLQTDGLFIAVAEVLGGAVALGATLLIAWLRRGPPLREYLALRPVRRMTVLRWLFCTVVLGVVLDGASYLAGYAAVPDWMLHVYRSAVFLPLLLVAFLAVAPVLEESVFRGFLLEGLRHSRLGDVGAVLLASLIWAITHVQYEWFYIAQVFVLGLLLGAARLATRSLLPPILMHALFSAIATSQAALQSWE